MHLAQSHSSIMYLFDLTIDVSPSKIPLSPSEQETAHSDDILVHDVDGIESESLSLPIAYTISQDPSTQSNIINPVRYRMGPPTDELSKSISASVTAESLSTDMKLIMSIEHGTASEQYRLFAPPSHILRKIEFDATSISLNGFEENDSCNDISDEQSRIYIDCEDSKSSVYCDNVDIAGITSNLTRRGAILPIDKTMDDTRRDYYPRSKSPKPAPNKNLTIGKMHGSDNLFLGNHPSNSKVTYTRPQRMSAPQPTYGQVGNRRWRRDGMRIVGEDTEYSQLPFSWNDLRGVAKIYGVEEECDFLE